MKKIILIDMDNTIVDYSTPIANAMKQEVKQEVNTDNWFTFTNQESFKKIQKRTQSEPHFFYDLQPIKGAIDCLKQLDELGYVIFIVSSPSISNPTCHSDKSLWLKENMGEYWARKLILTKDKTLIMGDYLIDDREDIVGVIDIPMWKHIMFTQPYNISCDVEMRLNTWDIYNVLKLITTPII